MNISKLIFFPKSTDNTFDSQSILNTLTKSQFIISEEHQPNHYLPGERFLSLITFLGCSPNINLFPVDGENHCFISFMEPTEFPSCVGYTKTANPKCPNCTKRIADWKISDWQLPGGILPGENSPGKLLPEKLLPGKLLPGEILPGKLCTCDKCQVQTPYTELNWKHECGFARCGFVVNHIYPHEALPTDPLLDLLKQAAGFEWDYSYANN